MSSKRSKLEIYFDVMKVISKGTSKPTKIMYETNLSWKPLLKILNSMLEQGLISSKETGTRTTYELTEKAKNILGYFNKATASIEIR